MQGIDCKRKMEDKALCRPCFDRFRNIKRVESVNKNFDSTPPIILLIPIEDCDRLNLARPHHYFKLIRVFRTLLPKNNYHLSVSTRSFNSLSYYLGCYMLLFVFAWNKRVVYFSLFVFMVGMVINLQCKYSLFDVTKTMFLVLINAFGIDDSLAILR